MKRFIAIAVFLVVYIGHAQTRKIDSLAVQLAYQKQDSLKVNISIDLIEALFKNKEYSRALLYITETEQLASSIGYKKGIADANYYKALIHTANGDYFNAMDHYNRAYALYAQIKDHLGLAKVGNSMALIEIERGNYLVGLNYSLKAIGIFEEQQLYEELGLAYHNLAKAYHRTDQLEKALDFNIKALRVRERLRDSAGIKSSSKFIALIYGQRKEHRKSIEFYEATLKMLDPKADQLLKAEILPRLGEQYLAYKEFEKAESTLREALDFNRQNGNDQGTLRALNAMGQLNLSRNKTKLAEVHIREAHQLARDGKHPSELLMNYKLLMALDSTKGKFQGAFNWQRQYFTLRQQLEEEKKPAFAPYDQLADARINLEEDAPTAFPSTSASEPGHEEKVKQLKFVSYGLIAAFMTALGFLLLIHSKRKSALSYTQELEEKNLQIQLQNQAIMEQKQSLEEINGIKDRLFSIVSHDLKDSISSITGFLDLLREESISKEEFDQLIPELSDNANSASMLLFNLLNWSKSQLQSLEASPEPFDIQEIYRSKLALLEQKMEQKRIVVIDESQPQMVYADRSMVEIIIQNLLTNAIKFCRVGDVITVSNRPHHGKAVLCIEDTGVGISKENLKKLFQNNNFTTRGTKNEKGTGLGLTICKELVELNNGQIYVESTQDVGSKFFVELPVEKT